MDTSALVAVCVVIIVLWLTYGIWSFLWRNTGRSPRQSPRRAHFRYPGYRASSTPRPGTRHPNSSVDTLPMYIERNGYQSMSEMREDVHNESLREWTGRVPFFWAGDRGVCWTDSSGVWAPKTSSPPDHGSQQPRGHRDSVNGASESENPRDVATSARTGPISGGANEQADPVVEAPSHSSRGAEHRGGPRREVDGGVKLEGAGPGNRAEVVVDSIDQRSMQSDGSALGPPPYSSELGET